MSSGPDSLAPWANIAFDEELEAVLRAWFGKVTWPELTRRVNATVTAFWTARGKVPPREVNQRTVQRWCHQFGIGDD